MQIMLAKEYQENTSFTTTWGTCFYMVMSFGLKNTDATYQRAMTIIFHDMIHKKMEVYVDDILVNSCTSEGHVNTLCRVLERAMKFKLWMNMDGF